VATGHLIYGLPRWHAYVLGLGTRPAVVRFRPGYRLARAQLRRLERHLSGEITQARSTGAPATARPAPAALPRRGEPGQEAA